jgi:hypothetical protein
MPISQRDFTSDWFRKRPNQIFTARELRERLTADYETLTGKIFGDPEKMVRMLFQENFIERPYDGHYVFQSDNDPYMGKFNFTEKEMIEVLERDNFKCVICKRGETEGISLSVGFAKSVLRGGLASVENGRTFCQRHKFISEIGQSSHSRSAQLRRLNALFPMSDKGGARSQTFWEDLIDLLGKYGVKEDQIYKENVAE